MPTNVYVGQVLNFLYRSDLICSAAVFHEFLPWIFAGSLSLLSVLLYFFLPETFRKPLPDTIQEMGHIQWSVCTVQITLLNVCAVSVVLFTASAAMFQWYFTSVYTKSGPLNV